MDTMKTMEDLREEVAERMRDSIHGREIDMLENDVIIAHMLGITEIGEEHNTVDEEGTLLDREHPFWDAWHDDVNSSYTAMKLIESAIRSLREEGVFTMTHPYGEDADIVIPEISEVSNNSLLGMVNCAKCGEPVYPSLSVSPLSRSDSSKIGSYGMDMMITCDSCGFSGLFRSNMTRQ